MNRPEVHPEFTGSNDPDRRFLPEIEETTIIRDDHVHIARNGLCQHGDVIGIRTAHVERLDAIASAARVNSLRRPRVWPYRCRTAVARVEPPVPQPVAPPDRTP